MKVGYFSNLGFGGAEATADLKPGESATFTMANGTSGVFKTADSDGNFQSTASRVEVQNSADGKTHSNNLSVIDGDNASMSLSDGQGKSKSIGSIGDEAPDSVTTTDSGGRKTITGWYDGSTSEMQAGGAFLESKLGTSEAYIHPNDDTLGTSDNPMTMAMDTSSHYDITFGDV